MTEAGRQTRRHHRHRRDRDPVRAVRRRSTPSSSTCSSARRRRSICAATSRPIRSGAKSLAAGLAARASRELRRHRGGAAGRRGSGIGRLDGHLPTIAVRRDGREGAPDPDPGRAAARAEIADFQKMNEIRARVDKVVRDTAAAEALKPWYRQLCKRPTFNDEFLATFNRRTSSWSTSANARASSASRRTAWSPTASSTRWTASSTPPASRSATAPRRRVSFDVVGRNDESLFDHWNGGLKTLHGFSSHGFPNWFFIGISQNGLSVNMTSMFDDQAAHIAYIVREVQQRGKRVVEVTPEAEQAWVAEIRRLAVNNHDFQEACTPGYYNNEGLLEKAEGSLAAEVYAPGINAFNALLAKWREAGTLEGMTLR